jgi:SAM-dependent methyltransferase
VHTQQAGAGLMENTEWTAGALLGLSGSYWQACTLHAGVKLDLFTLIGSEALSAEEIVERTHVDQRGVTMLLNALAAMGFLTKSGERYANTEASRSLLDKTSPRYVGHMVMHHHHLVEAWARLSESVLGGQPVRKRGGRDEEEREAFLMGMFNLAMGIAPHLVPTIDLSGRARLLDLGGGPGTYAIHFCLENPNLTATVYDLPTTEPFARSTIERFGLTDRIDFAAGDYRVDPVQGRFDVAWLSHILHGEGPETCRRIVKKAASVLEPGGLLMIHDFILEDTFDGPLFPALFSLNMLVNTEEGQSYTEAQIREMLQMAGLEEVRRLDFKGPNESGILAAVCPS